MIRWSGGAGLRHHRRVISMQPVLEMDAPDEDFALWPTGTFDPYGFLVLEPSP